ncbi:unnamed protein product [Amoebophrya sp. A25]|nr:unnamed protein product [Amoebophrya sp. A25]|eukprot:GSA25T00019197001.1
MHMHRHSMREPRPPQGRERKSHLNHLMFSHFLPDRDMRERKNKHCVLS